MNRAEILKAFRQLSAEEQEAVRTELGKKPIPEGASCCPPSMKEQLVGMMKKMEASEGPMAMCAEMMRMCHEKMSSGVTTTDTLPLIKETATAVRCRQDNGRAIVPSVAWAAFMQG